MTALAERNSWAAEGVDDLLKFSRKASQEEPQLVRTLRGHRGAVHGVAFSPTRRQLASTGGDGAVMLWSFGMRDEATRRERPTRAYRFEGHDGAVYCAASRPVHKSNVATWVSPLDSPDSLVDLRAGSGGTGASWRLAERTARCGFGRRGRAVRAAFCGATRAPCARSRSRRTARDC